MGGNFSCYVGSSGLGCGSAQPGINGLLVIGLILLAALAATVLYGKIAGRPRIENLAWPAEPLDLRRAGLVAGISLAFFLAFYVTIAVIGSSLLSGEHTFARVVPAYAWIEVLGLFVVCLLVLIVLATVAFVKTGRSLFPSRKSSIRSLAYGFGSVMVTYVALSLYEAVLLPSHPEIWWVPFAVFNLGIAVAMGVTVRRFWRLVVLR